jgi:vacuolar-type H+-ATPase subunit F/Vma7
VKAKIIAIGDPALVMGFRLAGIDDTIVVTEKTMQQEMEKTLQNKEYGVIITSEAMLNKIDWRLKRKLEGIAYPVIIPMPDHTGKSTEGDEIRNLIKRALGFDLGAKKQ